MTTAAVTSGAEAEFVRAKTSVWWDIENCEVPKNLDANTIAQNVSSALLKMNYWGPVSISAYGDTNLIPHKVQQALSSTGVSLNHVPAGVKDASDKKILVDMLLWAVDNPAPANFMLISGDRDFSNALHQLRMRRYTILLAQPPRASAPLVAAAKDVWLWTSLASGGLPLTGGESSRLVNNGRCHVSNYEASKYPVSEQAPSSKPTDSNSDGGGIKDHRTKENQIPRELPPEMRRNMLPNGRAQASVSAEPIQEAGLPLTSGESSRLVNNGRCYVSNFEVSILPVSKQAQSSKPTVFTSEAGVTMDQKTIENHVPSGLPQETRRNMLQNGRGAAGESMQAALADSRRAQARVSAQPILEAELVEPVVCKVCQISCTNKDAYKSHTYGKRHQKNLELQSGKCKTISVAAVEPPKEVGDKQKKKKKASEGRAKPNAEYVCRLCNVTCHRQIPFDSHLRGQKHAAMLTQSQALNDSKKLQEKAVGEVDQPRETIVEPQLQSQDAQENTIEKYVAMVNQSELDQALIGSKKLQEKGVREKDQPRETITEPKTYANYVCSLCNVVCQSQVVFDSHLRGQRHAAMVNQSEALFGSKKLQEKDVGEKDQPRETIAEPQFQSLKAQKNTKCFEKHVAMVNQSEAHIDSKKLQEKSVGEKEQPRQAIAEPQLLSHNTQENNKCFEKHVDMANQPEALISSKKLEEKDVRENAQPIETTIEPQSLSQNTQENTKFFEKRNKEFREICGTSESSVKEKFPSIEDRVDTVYKQLPNGEFFFGDLRCGFGVPIEARECFDGVVEPINLSEGATEHSGEVKKKQQEGMAAFVASDDAQSSVSTKPIKEPEVLQPVWCQVCQISCNSKVAYANHTYGKKHRQNLENISKVPAKFCKEIAEKKKTKKVVCQNQTVFDFHQNHPGMVKEHAEALVDSREIREESDQRKEKTKEQAVEKIEDLGFQGTQDNKELNESSERAFTELKRESLIQKESRHPLDVIPERVKLPPDSNLAENSQNQTVFDSQLKSQHHADMVKELIEKARVDPRRTQQEVYQRKLREALEQSPIADSRKFREESDQEKETTEEHTLVKLEDLGLREAHANAVAANLAHALTKLNQGSSIPKESSHPLDVIPDRVEMLPDVNVTEKLEDESKHKPEPKSHEPENESAGRKEHTGEVPKKEEIKGQADNFWTRLWGKKS